MYRNMEFYKYQIETAFVNAEKNYSKLCSEILEMEGMTGKKTRHFYNNLLDMMDARYLEIGTWKGSSVCSAMYENNATVVCIDNWSEFGGPKKEFMENFEKFKGNCQATFIEKDCFKVNVKQLPKFNIYMYDGDHTDESHYKAINYFLDCLDDIFILIVDDWNWDGVRRSTMKSIVDNNLSVLYSKQVRLTLDDSHTTQPLARETWHNGIFVAVLEKTKIYECHDV